MVNGFRFVQRCADEKADDWDTLHVDKADGLPPGIYTLNNAARRDAPDTKAVALHLDKEHRKAYALGQDGSIVVWDVGSVV